MSNAEPHPLLRASRSAFRAVFCWEGVRRANRGCRRSYPKAYSPPGSLRNGFAAEPSSNGVSSSSLASILPKSGAALPAVFAVTLPASAVTPVAITIDSSIRGRALIVFRSLGVIVGRTGLQDLHLDRRRPACRCSTSHRQWHKAYLHLSSLHIFPWSAVIPMARSPLYHCHFVPVIPTVRVGERCCYVNTDLRLDLREGHGAGL